MSILIRVFSLFILLSFLSNCSGTGKTVDSTVWDDIFDVSQELGKGKSISEALVGVVK